MFYWERDVFKPSKTKNATIYMENGFVISKIKVPIRILLDFSN